MEDLREKLIFSHSEDFMDLADEGQGRKYFILADSKVWNNFGKIIEDSLQNRGIIYFLYEVEGGEKAKTGEEYMKIISEMAMQGISRKDALMAIGGGTIGDIGGFVAATYMRGIGFVQVPTTLLAMVDSSIGGKNGINLKEGKNLAGTIRPADFIYQNTEFLKTLPKEQIISAMGEIIKYGIIEGNGLWNTLNSEEFQDSLRAESFNGKILLDIIKQCVNIKQQYVSMDQFDKGIRKTLNLGHTAAHGIEKLSEYSISHGEAVAKGLIIETKVAEHNGFCSSSTVNEIKNLIVALGLDPNEIFDKEEIREAAKNDKKKAGDLIDLPIIKEIGNCTVNTIDYCNFCWD